MNTQGSKWIRPRKRLRIYERDGWRCACCGRPVYSAGLAARMKTAPAAEAEPATLDHFKPRVRGGTNHERNLVTVCLGCNSSRQDRPMMSYLKQLEAVGAIPSASAASKNIKNLRGRKLPEVSG